MQATKLAFEKRYSDDSGVEFAVRLNAGDIEFEAVNSISFPTDQLDWLIAALARIKAETAPPATQHPEQGPHERTKIEPTVRRLADGLPADAVRFAGDALSVRVYRMDDMEWWVGESLPACVEEGRLQCGTDCYDDPSEQHELTDEQLQRLIFIDESDGTEPPVKRTFAEQLTREMAEGGPFPRPFAAEDW